MRGDRKGAKEGMREGCLRGGRGARENATAVPQQSDKL